MLQCLGLRPEEVCGLRWRNVNLRTGELAIVRVRTLVDGRLAGISSKCDGPRPGTSPGQSPD